MQNMSMQDQYSFLQGSFSMSLFAFDGAIFGLAEPSPANSSFELLALEDFFCAGTLRLGAASACKIANAAKNIKKQIFFIA
jgi:hypothetical protein